MVKDTDNTNDEPQVDSAAPEADEYGDTGGPIGEINPDAIVNEQDDLARLEAEAEDWKNKYQRALADYQNYQRRARENEVEARRQGVTGVIGSLLSVLDNFDLALQSDQSKTSIEQVVQGVEMIRSQLHQALSMHDVTRIEPEVGDEFDPHQHEAVQQMECEDVEPGRIAALFQVGYTMGERVLRPAKVMVSKAPEPDADEASTQGEDSADEPSEQES